MMSDEEVKANAVAFAKRHKKRIASERTDIEQYAPEERPISIFMGLSRPHHQGHRPHKSALGRGYRFD